ncbi:unnamed protein product [Mytilus edulis]|uniref:Uncharacterized protein n=1 Tax=Mytilus edulis TaxID=6550 RepID=A0A8S3R6I3_MYTED|nr:unnamed protein product [Mytilus edulis]
MSRYPKRERISLESVAAICNSAQYIAPLIESIAMSLDVLEMTDTPGQPMAQVDMRELRKQQRDDSLIGFWVRAVKDKRIPNKNEEEKLDTQSKNVKHTSEVKCDVTCEFETESDTDCELDISINYPPKINAHSIDGETQNANEVNTEQEIVLESPVPRRSARRRKKPEWHSFYQMNQISVRESLPETKHVLVNLISSGVLQGVSETMVSRIVNTVLDVG